MNAAYTVWNVRNTSVRVSVIFIAIEKPVLAGFLSWWKRIRVCDGLDALQCVLQTRISYNGSRRPLSPVNYLVHSETPVVLRIGRPIIWNQNRTGEKKNTRKNYMHACDWAFSVNFIYYVYFFFSPFPNTNDRQRTRAIAIIFSLPVFDKYEKKK